jgi:sialic acid synthase SpsE
VARALVIAEIGACHDGSLLRACALVHAAKEAGADIVKAQFWSDYSRLADRRRVPPAYREIYRRYQMPRHWLEILKAGADLEGIEFACSTYLPEDVAVVAPLVQRFKVASFEAADAELLGAHLPYLAEGREVFISTGMNTFPHPSVEQLIPYDCRHRVRYLHCVSAYPAPVEALNLAVLSWNDYHDCPVYAGFSDHSRHPLVGALAVAAGATVIEAHLRVETTDPQNPDYATAFSPAEFAAYVRNIRFAEQAMGDGEKKLQPCELEMARYRVGAQA